MKRTYVYENGKMVEKFRSKRDQHHYVQDDIKPYKSMIDGSTISSRSQHRRHLKRHGCIEVGNEKMENAPPKIEDSRRDVLRAQLVNMTHKDANKLLDRLRDNIRFSNPYRK